MAFSLRPISLCCPNRHLMDFSCTVKYKMRGFLGMGGTNTGGFVKHSFTLSKAT